MGEKCQVLKATLLTRATKQRNKVLLWAELQGDLSIFFMKIQLHAARLLLFGALWIAFQPAVAQTGQQTAPPPSSAGQATPEPEHKITPAEAKELFQSIDEILHFASTDTLLPIKHPVKKAMIDRAHVEKYIEDKFQDDVDRMRFERSELVLKKLGLLPRTFDLHSFLVKLLGEQVAGYYDEKTQTINLLDWVDMENQKPVMAHELTHALQDQSFNLGKMMKQDEEIEKRGPSDPNAQIRNDEESTCRSAVLEGQAMIVLLDYILAPMGGSVEKAPGIVDRMRDRMSDHDESAVFSSAPLLLREELVFPYNQGMKFIAELIAHGGKKEAFTGVLERMPLTTREIMEPQEYLAGHHIAPLLLPDLAFLKKDYEAFDAGAMGEFDVEILLKQYSGDEIADHLAPEWRGGAYYAAGRKGAKPADHNSTGHIGLLYVSKWSSGKAAEEFATAYAAALPKRYSKLEQAQAQSEAGSGAVEGKPEREQPEPGQADKDAAAGKTRYSSSDGPIFIQRQGNVVVVVESFEEPMANRLIEASLKGVEAQSQGQTKAQLGSGSTNP
ncbi:MAG TPA: hypothetical protein VKZ53_19430 [Candidatus Angelobacter sp.]|nr:hypothetical protein [Candidatus Angelobacter sp.]